jgi:hypothetical protein
MWQAFRRRWIWVRSRATRRWRAVRQLLRTVPWSVGVALVLLVLVAGTLLALRAFGLLDVTDGDDSGSRFTAALTLVGVLVSASVALVGHAINRQGEARQAVDSSIRAVGLFAKPDGSAAEPLVTGGGLLALANLGQLDFAISLLSGLWGRDRVTREAAITLIDKGLRSGDPATQLDAAYVLHTNSERLWQLQPSGRVQEPGDGSLNGSALDEGSPKDSLLSDRSYARRKSAPSFDATFDYPSFLYLRWDDSLSFEAKERLAGAWVYFWISAPSEVDVRLREFVMGLDEIWRTETTPAIRGSVGLLLKWALGVQGVPDPIEAWVRGSRRHVSAELTQEIDRWRERRSSRRREVAGLVTLRGRVTKFVEDCVKGRKGQRSS